MQAAILALTAYWIEHGCVLAQPYNTEVGAGTLNPATFLRVLGPEPWRTAYVEPSVRPDDSRYGENPNRLQTHTQFQVILKPDPGNSQELYLGSLSALGVDTRRHDVRFVEDNWESPALGAWGLGWEVWLDGLEITQFTYFQQAGGLPLDPVAVEITYGLERIVMAAQGVDHFKAISFTETDHGTISYGEIQGQAELEMSTYYLDEADVGANRQLFALFHDEAERLLQRRLPVPAYHFVLKCSHIFNVLDARGAIGTTERARAFARMRRLAHDVAELWVERREELDHPLGISPSPAPTLARADGGFPDQPATLLLEIGTEELPPSDVDSAIEQVRSGLAKQLADHRLEHDAVEAFGTPRRIVAIVPAVAANQPDRVVSVRGPRLDVAFDPDGNPTHAAMGFARKQGLDIAELRRPEDSGATHLVVSRTEVGRPAGEVLTEILPRVIASLRFERNMRWGAAPVAFSRPLRWIVALLDGAVVPFVYANVASGRTSRVLRDDQPPSVTIIAADAHLTALAAQGIACDGARRQAAIVSDAEALAASAGGALDLDGDRAVVAEVTNLVEQPVVLLGRFDERYLELPAEVLSVVMKKHQRYLPVYVPGGSGDLLACFVAVANGPVDVDVVRAGNEAVLRARYADAAFFFGRDMSTPLAEFRPRLATLVFEERAGTMLDRAERTADLARWLGDRLSLSPTAVETLERAALLAKADLATEMVVELSSLAGVMGRIYALRQGESPEVAEAIFEQTLPRFGGDRLPETAVGAILAIADRADALAAMWSVGAQPTGSADPYGLRRAALGLVQILIGHRLDIDLRELFGTAGDQQAVATPPAAVADLLEFVTRRLEQRLLDEGHPPDLVRAVLVAAAHPARAVATLTEVEALLPQEHFRTVASAYRRSARIGRGSGATGEVDAGRLDDVWEKALWEAFQAASAEIDAATSLTEFVARFEPLVAPIDAFFEHVMVMADDEALRSNRLRILSNVTARGAEFLDWDAIVDL